MWESRVAYPQNQYTLTMAPRIAKGKVLIGASGSEYPVRGFVDAFDANTGQKAWRFYTVPGDPSKPFENDAMKKAAPTWSGEWYKMGGGGTVWDGMAYDPQANLVYFGTGNGGPWPEVLRGSQGKDNLYVCSIIAVNPDTGEMKWYYQAVPGDSWDYDSVQQLTLADIPIGGRTRRVIMQANKNGYFYVIDRITGEFISASPFAPLNWSEAMDKKTGRPFIHPRAFYGTDPVTIFPGPLGAHNWSPMSFNPQTGLVYVPSTLLSSSTYTVNPTAFVFKEGGRNTGTGRGAAPPEPASGRDTCHTVRAADGRSERWPARRRADRVGSGDTNRAVAQGRRRRVGWRNRHHRRQSGAPGSARWPARRLQRRQRREAARNQHRPAHRHGTADHLHGGRQAIRHADRRSWRGCAAARGGRSRNCSRSCTGDCGWCPGWCARDRARRSCGGRTSANCAAEDSDVRARRWREVTTADDLGPEPRHALRRLRSHRARSAKAGWDRCIGLATRSSIAMSRSRSCRSRSRTTRNDSPGLQREAQTLASLNHPNIAHHSRL